MSETVFTTDVYGFNPWALPPFLVAILMVVVSLRALARPGRFEARTLGAAWGLCAAVWLGCQSLVYCAVPAEVALAWARVGMIGGIFLAPLALNFAYAFLGPRPRSGFLQAAAWVLAVCFAVTAALSDLLLAGVREFFWGYYPRFGPLAVPFIGYTVSVLLWVTAQHTFLHPHAPTSRSDKARRRALRAGVLVANLAAVDLLAALGLPVYPFGWLGALAVMVGAEYAQRRSGLWTVEHAMQESQILDAINEGVLVVETNFQVYFSSRAAQKMFPSLNDPAFCLEAATSGVVTRHAHRRVLNGEAMPLLETALTLADGEKRTYSVSTSVARDTAGQPAGAIYVFRDTTAYTKAQESLRSMQEHLIEVHKKARAQAEGRLKQVEDKLIHVAKMDALGQMAGGVAHDFNNILTAIIGGCDMALKGNELADRTTWQLQRIRAAGEQGAKITRQLLAYSRKQPLRPDVLMVDEAVADTAKLLSTLIPDNVAIDYSLAANEARVLAEPGQLTQVLLNLAINARDAMPNGGQLSIRTATVAERSGPDSLLSGLCGPGRYAVVTIQDTGCGMDSETRRRIFDPFFTTKAKGKGTGLGLSVAYGAVRQMGGDILVESQPGEGSTFHVLLPITDSTREIIAPSSPSREPRATGSILVVEDEAAVREIVTETLTSLGHRVREASNGVEAVQILDAVPGSVNLVLTDMVMPSMGGGELAALIAARHPDIRVIAMSGHLGHHDISDLQKVVSSVLIKPFGRDELLASVRAALPA